MKPIDVIRTACVKANPGIEDKFIHRNREDRIVLRLTDVLLAIRSRSILVDIVGNFWEWKSMDEAPQEVPCSWNLRNDDLSEQSEETISFLAGLLNRLKE